MAPALRRLLWHGRFWAVTAAASAAAVLLAEILISAVHRDARHPHASQSPTEVVRIQLGALAESSGIEADDGIEIAYRFASPSNRAQTGPLARFRRIVRAPAFRPMIGHLSAEYGELSANDRQAIQPVTILAGDGQSSTYVFQLTRQNDGPLAGCWLTDAVYPVEEWAGPESAGLEI